MNNIQLFIENHEIELNESVTFAITKQFEDINNPTTIINDWSKTVEIPFTDRNNKIFGHIYCPDKVVVDGDAGADKVGVYFNPYLKLDMKLIYNGMPLMTGYAKMTEVSRKDGSGSYKINLNGTLGKIFQELKKITFDETEYADAADKDKYWIDGSQWVEGNINKTLVKSSWTSSGQTQSSLQPKYRYVINPTTGEVSKIVNPAYRVTDIIGFAPCNAKDDDFDYSQFQDSPGSSKTFGDVLDYRYSEELNLTLSGSDLVKDGMLPREIGEFRSYLQMPFIYFNKLFQIFKAKAEALTGYSFNLDSDWFNTNNPYWYNLVFMLSKFNPSNGTNKENVYGNVDTPTGYIADWRINNDYTQPITYSFYPTTTSYEPTPIFSNKRFSVVNQNFILFKNNLNLKLSELEQGGNHYLKDDNALEIDIIMTGENGATKSQKFVVIDESASTMKQAYKSTAYQIIEVGSFKQGNPNYITFNVNSAMSVSNNESFGNYVTFSIKSQWKNNTFPVGGTTATVEMLLNVVDEYSQVIVDCFDKYNRSNGKFILNDLWNNDYNIFEEIVRYCKVHRIFITVDDNDKKINFIPMTKYFQDYTIEDWSDKADFGKDFIIKPITFEDKFVSFNYDDSQTEIGKKYVDKFGMKFGEKKIITEYNFNTDTDELFEGCKEPIVNTDNIFSWANLYAGNVIYSFPAEIYVYSKDSSNNFVDNFGAYYFHCGLSNFDTEESLNLRNVWISDDTEYQVGYSTYFYTQVDSLMTRATTYPHLDIVYGDNLCTFGKPAECYTYLNNYSGKVPVYYNFWKKYIEERYSIQNKIVTCYLVISPEDYYKFRFNKFIKIDNQLYLVNKIYDYDMTSNEPTKVDLITIQSIEGYTDNNYE